MAKEKDRTQADYELTHNQYGFRWGDVLVERTAASLTKPKFQVMRIYAPNGEGVEIQFSPRKLFVTKFKKEKSK